MMIMAAIVLAEHFLFKETEVYNLFSNDEKKTDHTSTMCEHKVSRTGNTTKVVWK